MPWPILDTTPIAGDIFVATNQDSTLAVMTQREEIRSPPRDFATDRGAAESS